MKQPNYVITLRRHSFTAKQHFSDFVWEEGGVIKGDLEFALIPLSFQAIEENLKNFTFAEFEDSEIIIDRKNRTLLTFYAMGIDVYAKTIFNALKKLEKEEETP